MGSTGTEFECFGVNDVFVDGGSEGFFDFVAGGIVAVGDNEFFHEFEGLFFFVF